MTQHDGLARELEALAHHLTDGPSPTPSPSDVWRSGARRRWRTRGLALGAGAAAVALVASAVVSVGGAPRSMPATGPGEPLTSYPENVVMPFSLPATRTPGTAALVLPGEWDGRRAVFTVGPAGAVAVLDTGVIEGTGPSDPAPDAEDVALSPDGRWVASATSVRDLVTGRELGIALDRSRTQVENGLRGTPWWSPDSRRVLVPGLSSSPASIGIVVDVGSGSTSVVPPAGVGDALVLAGWRDGSTVVGVWRSGVDTVRILTWTVGGEQWTDGATITWPAPTSDQRSAATLSPDGSRVLLLDEAPLDDATQTAGTRAQVFDAGSGALVGFAPATSWAEGSYVEWAGWGCRPAWRDGEPVITDNRSLSLAGGPRDPLVRLSSDFGTDVCPAFPGDAIQGAPVANSGAVWAERVRTWGLPLAGVVLVGLLVWWKGRRQQWKRDLGSLPFIYQVGGR